MSGTGCIRHLVRLTRDAVRLTMFPATSSTRKVARPTGRVEVSLVRQPVCPESVEYKTELGLVGSKNVREKLACLRTVTPEHQLNQGISLVFVPTHEGARQALEEAKKLIEDGHDLVTLRTWHAGLKNPYTKALSKVPREVKLPAVFKEIANTLKEDETHEDPRLRFSFYLPYCKDLSTILAQANEHIKGLTAKLPDSMGELTLTIPGSSIQTSEDLRQLWELFQEIGDEDYPFVIAPYIDQEPPMAEQYQTLVSCIMFSRHFGIDILTEGDVLCETASKSIRSMQFVSIAVLKVIEELETPRQVPLSPDELVQRLTDHFGEQAPVQPLQQEEISAIIKAIHQCSRHIMIDNIRHGMPSEAAVAETLIAGVLVATLIGIAGFYS